MMGRGSTRRLHEILGKSVYDAGGRKLGRVHDVLAERRGDTLRVTALLVGAGGLLNRFGWASQDRGTVIPWEEITSIEPRITLRTTRRGGNG